MAASLYRSHAFGHRRDDARRQGPLRLPGMVQHPGRRHAIWFRALGRGTGSPAGGRFVVDMWPDVSEYDPQDLCAVPGLKMPDGSPARLYSAFRKGPVLLHCKWMRQYGIDGVFLSRFVGETASPARARHVNTVLANVREGCHREGRVWAMMLDLSMGRDATTAIVMNDWKFLCDKVKVRDDSRYLHHQGKPVVLLWGLGFRDRPWTPEQGEELIDFFKNDPHYGGVYLIGGVDPYWRTLARRIAPRSGVGEGLSEVRRHQSLGRRPLSGRRRHGPRPQGRVGRRSGRVEGPGDRLHADGLSRVSPGTTSPDAAGHDR